MLHDYTGDSNGLCFLKVCVGYENNTLVIHRLEMLHEFIGDLTQEEKTWKNPMVGPYLRVRQAEVFKWLWNHGYAADTTSALQLEEFWEKAIHLNVAVWLMNSSAFSTKKTLDEKSIIMFLRTGQYSLLEMVYAKSHQLTLITELSCKTFFNQVNSVITFAQLGCHNYIPISVAGMSETEKEQRFTLHMKACHKLKSWIRYFRIHKCDNTCKKPCVYCGGPVPIMKE